MPQQVCAVELGHCVWLVFWERQLSESSDHPVPLVTPSARNPLGRSQNLVFCLDSIYREIQNAKVGAMSSSHLFAFPSGLPIAHPFQLWPSPGLPSVQATRGLHTST